MDFLEYPPSMSSSSSSSSSSYLHMDFSRREIRKKSFKACQMITKFIRAVITLVFALAGSIIGAVTGAIVGVTTEAGLLRGAGVGAISGAVYVIEAAESSNLVILDSYGQGIFDILDPQIDLVFSLLTGRSIHEKVGLALQTAIQNEITAMDFPFVEGIDVCETCGPRGMSRDAIENLTRLVVSPNDCRNSSGEIITCAVCIQDFRVGEEAIKLPQCHHIYHSQCIRGWLLKHGSCPLCRRSC